VNIWLSNLAANSGLRCAPGLFLQRFSLRPAFSSYSRSHRLCSPPMFGRPSLSRRLLIASGSVTGLPAPCSCCDGDFRPLESLPPGFSTVLALSAWPRRFSTMPLRFSHRAFADGIPCPSESPPLRAPTTGLSAAPALRRFGPLHSALAVFPGLALLRGGTPCMVRHSFSWRPSLLAFNLALVSSRSLCTVNACTMSCSGG